MAIFFKSYSIVVDKDFSTATSIFRDNLDDMSKKGYSLSGNTVIYNSDHKAKYFSGEYKGDCFVVRETDQSSDDFYYRLLPRHEIRFEDCNGKTKINVKSKSTFGLFMAFIFFIITLLVFYITYVCVFLDEANKLNMLFTLIPIAMLLVASLMARNSINNTKDTLEYIYKKADG